MDEAHRWQNELPVSLFLSLVKPLQGPQEIVLRREDFNGPDGKELEWSKIATFEITVLDTANNQKIELVTGSGTKTIQSIMLVE